jgi:hypothetical protein
MERERLERERIRIEQVQSENLFILNNSPLQTLSFFCPPVCFTSCKAPVAPNEHWSAPDTS